MRGLAHPLAHRPGGLRAAAMAGAVLSMAETAAAVGLSYDRFRKQWPQMRAREGFPSPVRRRTWLAAAVLGWMVTRSQAAPPAPRALPAPSPERRADAAWNQLERARG